MDVGIFIFHIFSKVKWKLKKNTQDFCVFFLYLEIEIEKLEKK